MVATDDGAGGDDKMDDSCNGNEATTAAALVSQIGAGEPMQVDGDGNFILPQVDGPMDTLLSDDEEKMDADEEPTLQNVTESANVDESATIAQQNPPENTPLEESILKDEAALSEATAVDLPESIAVTADEAPEKTEGNIVENQSNDTEMNTTLDNSDNAELPIEKETEDNPLDEIKDVKSELPLLQSPAEASSEQTSLTDVAEPTAETQQDETIVVKDEKNESFEEKEEKLLESINLPTEDTDMPQLSQDEVQNIEKKEPEADLPAESSPLVKSEETHDEPMDTTDDIKSTSPIDTVNITPVTTPVAMPSIQMKLEEKESIDEEKLPEPPVSSIPINGVATPLEKETENVKEIHTPVKMDISDDSVVPKRETMSQEKINDARSETGDDSTALTTLATAALGSAESVVKVKNEQVHLIISRRIICYYIQLLLYTNVMCSIF